MDALGTLKNITELVKKYNDLELMKQIVELQTEVFSLQQDKLGLEKVVAELRNHASAEVSMQRKGNMGYYFLEGDSDPFCPKCWENDRKQIRLPMAEAWNGGMRRDCRVCNETYWEKEMDFSPTRVRLSRR